MGSYVAYSLSEKLLHTVILISGIILSYFAIVLIRPDRIAAAAAFLILASVLYNFRRVMIRPGPAKTGSGAIVMSMGVFVSDAMNKFPGYIHSVGKLTVLIIFVIWLFLMIDYAMIMFRGRFLEEHWTNPLNSFAIGTWLAGSSVCSMGLFMFLREWHWAAVGIISVNTVFWIIYAVHSLYQYKKLIEIKTSLVHGIVLLATVSTQSLVVDYSIWLLGDLPVFIYRLLLLIGAFFYIIFILLMIKRYTSLPWQLIEDWKNTNCTIHGALSITGLASILSKTVPVAPIITLWWVVMFLFIVVEAIEITRAVKRLKKFGYRIALGTYDVSQWTRNFTFSMFLAFTIHLPVAGLSPIEKSIFQGFTNSFGVLVICLFIYETVLYFKENLVRR